MGIKEKKEEKLQKLRQQIVLSDTSDSEEIQKPKKSKKDKKNKKKEIEEEQEQEEEIVIVKKEKKSKKDKKIQSENEELVNEEEEEQITKEKKEKKSKKNKKLIQEEKEEEIEVEEEEEIVKPKKQKKSKKQKKEIVVESEESEEEKPKKQKKNKKQKKEVEVQIESEESEQEKEQITKKVKLNNQEEQKKEIQQEKPKKQSNVQEDDGKVHELIIQGLSFESSQEDIEQWLDNLSTQQKVVKNVKLLWDIHNNRSRGTAFVKVNSQDFIFEAISKLHQTEFMGRKVRVQNAGERQQKEDGINHETVPFGTKTILVRNLSFKATEDDIKKVFSKSGEILKVRLEKLNGKSRGYCYVDYSSSDGSNTAVQDQNNVEVLGRSVKVTLGHPEKSEDQIKAKKMKYLGFTYDENYNKDENQEKNQNGENKQNQNNDISDTIFVGNLDFEVQEDDIKDFFQQYYGEVTQVRLAKYEDGSLKGFGFVVFADPANCDKAIENNGSEFRNRALIIQSSSSKGKK